jgi:hypothetical protein
MERGVVLFLILIFIVGNSFVSVYAQEATTATSVGGTGIIETPVECIDDGEVGVSFVTSDVCCAGLVKISNAHFGNGGCVAPTDGSFICSKCGNGVCGAGENYCNCNDCCKEGETKKYTCPDGTKVGWCVCDANGMWTCVNSPENSCASTTCSMPVCSEGISAYFTGEYDENDCPIYKCLGTSCSPGIGEEFICPDGTSVPSCHCTENSEWVCVENPEQQCSEIVCPEGCVCNNNIITCPSATSGGGGGGVAVSEASTGIACPIGCICTEETIVCETTAESGCAVGCQLDSNCVLPGMRTSVDGKRYCDIDSQWKEQKDGDEACDNNFECETNLCIDGKCISQGLWQKILSWFKDLF